jgi:hypothetical protein
VVELYLSRSRACALPQTTARARSGAAQLRAEGTPVHFLRSIFLPEDEICFLFFEGASEEVVAEAARRGRITFERVVAAEVAANRKPHAEERQRRAVSKPPLRFSGETWTDARGQATVFLPTGGQGLECGLDCELELLVGAGETRLASDLSGGSFVIETDEPHAKVAWRLLEGGTP